MVKKRWRDGRVVLLGPGEAMVFCVDKSMSSLQIAQKIGASITEATQGTESKSWRESCETTVNSCEIPNKSLLKLSGWPNTISSLKTHLKRVGKIPSSSFLFWVRVIDSSDLFSRITASGPRRSQGSQHSSWWRGCTYWMTCPGWTPCYLEHLGTQLWPWMSNPDFV